MSSKKGKKVSFECTKQEQGYDSSAICRKWQSTGDTERNATILIDTIKLLESLDPRLISGSGRAEARTRLAQEYAEVGVENMPRIVVARSKDARLDGALLSGWNRLNAAKRQGLNEVEVELLDVNDFAEAFTEAVRSNSTFGDPMTKEEKQNAACRMIDEYGISVKDAAKALGQTQRTIERWTEDIRQAKGSAKVQQIKDMVTNEGLSTKEAGKIAGVSERTAFRYKTEANDIATPEGEDSTTASITTVVSDIPVFSGGGEQYEETSPIFPEVSVCATGQRSSDDLMETVFDALDELKEFEQAKAQAEVQELIGEIRGMCDRLFQAVHGWGNNNV